MKYHSCHIISKVHTNLNQAEVMYAERLGIYSEVNSVHGERPYISPYAIIACDGVRLNTILQTSFYASHITQS